MIKFDLCGVFFNTSLHCGPHTFSIGVVALGFQWYRIEALILILKKCPQLQILPHHRSDTAAVLRASEVFFFPCWGTENSQMVPNQGNMEGDHPVQRLSHAQQTFHHRLVCRSIALVSIVFPIDSHVEVSWYSGVFTRLSR